MLQSNILLPKLGELPILLCREASEFLKLLELLDGILDPLVLDADPFLEYSVLSHETLDELLLFVNDLSLALIFKSLECLHNNMSSLLMVLSTI